MTPQEFFNKYNGVGLDVDNYAGDQCVDVFLAYNRDVVGGNWVAGNAIDYWTTYPFDYYKKIANTPDNFPSKGDVIIFGQAVGQYGHICICNTANADSFNSFDQNWPVGSNCHFQDHNYNGVLGWLQTNSQPQTTTEPSEEVTVMTPELRKELDDIKHDLQNAENLTGTLGKNLAAYSDSFVTKKDLKELTDGEDTRFQAELDKIPGLVSTVAPGIIQKLIDSGAISSQVGQPVPTSTPPSDGSSLWLELLKKLGLR